MRIKNFIQNQKAVNEAATTGLKLIGPDQDELLDAIAFINKGIGKGSQRVKLPFGDDTLDALEDDGTRTGKEYVIAVKANRPGSKYIDTVNAFLDDHGFGCRLTEAMATVNEKTYLNVYHVMKTDVMQNVKDLNYTLTNLQKIYNISNQDMQATVDQIQAIIDNSNKKR